MIICGIVMLGILGLYWMYRKGKLPKVLEPKEMRYVFLILGLSNLIAIILFVSELFHLHSPIEILRNGYGEGSRTETFEVTLEGELESEPITVEIQEQKYTYDETKEMFEEILGKLDEIVLGENESFDHVVHDLQLVTSLEEYPVTIQWEIDTFDVLESTGAIFEAYAKAEGTLVEIRGTIRYGEEMAVYVAHAMVFPKEKSEKEKLLDKIADLVEGNEQETREEASFVLPDMIDGKEIQWEQKKDATGYYILALGIITVIFLIAKNVQDKKDKMKKRQEEMMRDYPEIVSKFTLLLNTGMTLKAVWTKIVQTYEEQKGYTGIRSAYEEMCVTYREMQSGIPEKEAYERFGQRCGIIPYMKLGALLSQNLKKGSKGLTEMLAMESIQAFEERKSQARKAGEEASTKLMLPMFGMLAVVLIMVIVPAFLTMQI